MHRKTSVKLETRNDLVSAAPGVVPSPVPLAVPSAALEINQSLPAIRPATTPTTNKARGTGRPIGRSHSYVQTVDRSQIIQLLCGVSDRGRI